MHFKAPFASASSGTSFSVPFASSAMTTTRFSISILKRIPFPSSSWCFSPFGPFFLRNNSAEKAFSLSLSLSFFLFSTGTGSWEGRQIRSASSSITIESGITEARWTCSFSAGYRDVFFKIGTVRDMCYITLILYCLAMWFSSHTWCNHGIVLY